MSMFNNLEEPKVTKQSKQKRKKQKLEGLFSSSLKQYSTLLSHKLHNNPLAHQSTHADFEVFNKRGFVFFIEAKEVQLNNNGYGSFPFSRLTQRNSLLFYNKFSAFTHSFLLLMFRGNTMANSHTYFIPIERWVNFEQFIGKKSANNTDVFESFGDCLVDYNGSFFVLDFLL